MLPCAGIGSQWERPAIISLGGFGMEKWTKVGLTMLVAGLVIMVLTAPMLRNEVVGQEVLTVDDGLVSMGPYDAKWYSWSIWIEDYYEGFDDDIMFDTYASKSPEGNGSYNSDPPQDYRTMEIEGVECELMHRFQYLGSDDIYFFIEWREEPLGGPEDSVQLFIVRSGGIDFKILFAIGVVLAALGGIAVGLLLWSARKRQRDGLTDQG